VSTCGGNTISRDYLKDAALLSACDSASAVTPISRAR
jgi:hypothetical protein